MNNRDPCLFLEGTLNDTVDILASVFIHYRAEQGYTMLSDV